MIDSSSYVLSFDFTDLITDISDVEKSYTSFGSTVKGIANATKEDVSDLKGQMEDLSLSLSHASEVLDAMYEVHHSHMKLSLSGLEEFMEKSKSISENINKIAGVDLTTLPSVRAEEIDTVRERREDVLPSSGSSMDAEVGGGAAKSALDAAEAALSKADSAVKAAKEALGTVEESENRLRKAVGGIVDTVRKDLQQGQQSMIQKMKGAIPGVVGGGILGSLFGLMILGIKEDVRKESEAGEMLNVFESVTGSVFEEGSQKAAKWFGDFQEKAQFFYGIGRKEVQRVVKQFVDAGYTSKQIMAEFNNDLGEVGTNVGTLALGLDKLWNVATGTSGQNINKFVAEYGDNLDEAADKYTRLTFAAQRSGMGVSRFIDSVMSGSQALTQYGIDVEDVAQIMGKLKQHYEDMGLGEQYAGTMATQGVAGITGGIAGMSGAFRAQIAQRVTPGKDIYQTLQKFQEGFARIAEGEDENFLQKTVQALSDESQAMVGTDRAKRIFFLQQKGFKNEGAVAIVDAADKFEKGIKIADLNRKETSRLRKSFETEGKQLSELQKTQRELIKGLAKIGEGILKTLVGLLAAVASGFKGAFDLVRAMAEPDPLKKAAMLSGITDRMEGQWDLLLDGFKDIEKGAEYMKDHPLGRLLKTISKPLGKALGDDDESEGDPPPLDIVSAATAASRAYVLGTDPRKAIDDEQKIQATRSFIVDIAKDTVSEWWNDAVGDDTKLVDPDTGEIHERFKKGTPEEDIKESRERLDRALIRRQLRERGAVQQADPTQGSVEGMEDWESQIATQAVPPALSGVGMPTRRPTPEAQQPTEKKVRSVKVTGIVEGDVIRSATIIAEQNAIGG